MSFSLVIQGPLSPMTEHIVESAENCKEIEKIIVSHWKTDLSLPENENRDLLAISEGSKVTFLALESIQVGWNKMNIHHQAYTTMRGLQLVETSEVIKVRSDWPYTKFSSIIEKFKTDKILTSNLFFRPFSMLPFHCSDHLIAGKTAVLLEAFTKVFERCANHDIKRDWHSINPAVEQIICDELLNAKRVTSRSHDDMKCNFNVITVEDSCDFNLVGEDAWKFTTQTHDAMTNVIKSDDEI